MVSLMSVDLADDTSVSPGAHMDFHLEEARKHILAPICPNLRVEPSLGTVPESP